MAKSLFSSYGLELKGHQRVAPSFYSRLSSACRGLCELEKVQQEQYNKKEGKREQKGQQHSDLHRTYTVRHLSPIETRNSPRATLSDGTDGYPLTDTCEPRAHISTPLLHTSRYSRSLFSRQSTKSGPLRSHESRAIRARLFRSYKTINYTKITELFNYTGQWTW